MTFRVLALCLWAIALPGGEASAQSEAQKLVCESSLGSARMAYPDQAHRISRNIEIVDYTPQSIPGPSLASEFGFLVGNREATRQLDSRLKEIGLAGQGEGGLCASTCAANIGHAIARYMKGRAGTTDPVRIIREVVRAFDRAGLNARAGVGHQDIPLMWPPVSREIKLSFHSQTDLITRQDFASRRLGIDEIWNAGVSAGPGTGHSIVILRKTPHHIVYWDPNHPTLLYRSKHFRSRVDGYNVLNLYLLEDDDRELAYKVISLTSFAPPLTNR